MGDQLLDWILNLATSVPTEDRNTFQNEQLPAFTHAMEDILETSIYIFVHLARERLLKEL